MAGDYEVPVEDEVPDGPAPMDDDQLKAVVGGAITDAADYIDTFIAPQRAEAIKYYRGDLFGNEEEGRSRIVMTEVRDVVQAVIPGLLRIFAQSDQVVEFAPRTAQSVAVAEQATDYVNYVFQVDNPGFSILHSVFKDALISKIGVAKWRWSEDVAIEEATYTGLDVSQAQLLQQEPDLEVVEYTETVTQDAVVTRRVVWRFRLRLWLLTWWFGAARQRTSWWWRRFRQRNFLLRVMRVTWTRRRMLGIGR